MNNRQFEYFIVALTTTGKLISSYIVAKSIAYAMDTFIEQHDLAGQIAEYRFCLRHERFLTNPNDNQ